MLICCCVTNPEVKLQLNAPPKPAAVVAAARGARGGLDAPTNSKLVDVLITWQPCRAVEAARAVCVVPPVAMVPAVSLSSFTTTGPDGKICADARDGKNSAKTNNFFILKPRNDAFRVAPAIYQFARHDLAPFIRVIHAFRD